MSGDVHSSDDRLELITDAELVRRLTAREEAALVELYRRYARRIYPLIRRIVVNDSLAQDTLQEVFLRLWTRAALYRAEDGVLLAWLLTMARHLALDAVRKDKRWRAQLEFEESVREGTADPPRVDVETALSLRALVAALPPEQRRALELTYFGGMSHAELAAHLGEPLGTVKSRLRLALDKLRAALGRGRREKVLP